jgi:outer membrane cobalamin receptor
MQARRLWILAFVLALHGVARAEESGTPAATRSETKSSSDMEDAEDASGVEEMVVYGMRTGILAPIPGADTSVIFADDYIAENKSIADLLSEEVGVSVRRFGAAGDRSEISIRGSSPNQVVVTIDGVKTNSALTGGLDLSSLCLPLLDRIEVIRGAGSTAEGSGAIGGVVNVVTRGVDAEPETRGAFTGGSFETFEGSLLHSGRVEEVNYSVGYCGSTTQGDFDFARPTEESGGVSASYDPGNTTRINNDRIQHGGTLGLGTRLGAGEIRFSDFAVYSSGGEPGTDSGDGVIAGQATDAHSRNLSNLAQLRWLGPAPFGLGGEFEAGVYHRYESTHFRDPNVVFRPPIDVEVRLSTVGGRMKAGVDREWLGLMHEMDLWLDGSEDLLESNEQNNRSRPQAGMAVTDSIQFFDGKLVVAGGGRLDWTDGYDVKVLPTAGIVVSPYPWIRLRGHVDRAYRAPNFDELYHPDEGFIRGNENLSAEDAWNFDAGLEFRLAEAGPLSNITFSVGWFRREIDESIVWVLVNPQTIAPINTGSATTDGYELALSLNVTRYVALSANHTHIDSRRDSTGIALPSQADEEAFARVQLGLPEQWKLIGEMQYVGEILVNEGGSRTLPSRTVWNASASINLAALRWLPVRKWARELWLSAQLRNVGDTAVRDTISFPQPGRNWSAGLEVIW